MIFATHLDWPEHSILSPSRAHIWFKKSDEELIDSYESELARERGTKMHEFAARAIKIPLRMPKSDKEVKDLIWYHVGYQFPLTSDQINTIRDYINDAIGFGLSVETRIGFGDPYISSGTTDAISYRDNFLRIHDLKTGVTPAHMEQLMAYAALACIEYDIKPFENHTELRIYQNAQIIIHEPDPDEISRFIDRYMSAAEVLKKRKAEYRGA